MLMRDVEYVKPDTVEEALQLLADRKDGKCLAGGQTLVNVMKLRLASPGLIVDLNGLSELKEIVRDGNYLKIGAMATYQSIAANSMVQADIPVVSSVADHIADRQVRNRGTIGGNCCFNDPTSNFPPLLCVLQAKFEILEAHGGKRLVDAADFFIAPYQTAVRSNELLGSVYIPIPDGNWGTSYMSLRVGNDGPAILHVSAYVGVNDGAISECRIAIGCVQDAPYRLKEFESEVVASNGTSEDIKARIAATPWRVKGIADSHGSAEYREQMSKVYAFRAVMEAIEQAGRRYTRE